MSGEGKFKAAVTQFLRPNGRQVQMEVELPLSSLAHYDDMREAGCRLEAEVLTTGQVSVAVSDSETDVDIRIVSNGPEVIAALEDMLARQAWTRRPRDG